MLRILRIAIALTVIIASVIGLYTGQNNFLPLSQFLLGTLMFLIAIEQIKKKIQGQDLFVLLLELSVGLFLSVAIYIKKGDMHAKRTADYFITYCFIYSSLQFYQQQQRTYALPIHFLRIDGLHHRDRRNKTRQKI